MTQSEQVFGRLVFVARAYLLPNAKFLTSQRSWPRTPVSDLCRAAVRMRLSYLVVNRRVPRVGGQLPEDAVASRVDAQVAIRIAGRRMDEEDLVGIEAKGLVKKFACSPKEVRAIYRFVDSARELGDAYDRLPATERLPAA